MTEGFGKLANIALSGQKYQRIAARTEAALLYFGEQVHDLLAHTFVPILGIANVLHLDGVGTPADLNNGCAIKMLRKAVHIDGGRCDDNLEIRPAR